MIFLLFHHNQISKIVNLQIIISYKIAINYNFIRHIELLFQKMSIDK